MITKSVCPKRPADAVKDDAMKVDWKAWSVNNVEAEDAGNMITTMWSSQQIFVKRRYVRRMRERNGMQDS